MIIPAILEANFDDIKKKVEISKIFAKKIHIDFIDGKFIDNKNFIDDIGAFKEFSHLVDLEAHLMVEEPIEYLDQLSSAGFTDFIGHIEKMNDQEDFVVKGEELGGVGLALDLDTSIEDIKIKLDDLDQILLMSVKAGRSGQDFDEKIISKIKKLREAYFGKIEIDGGINKETLVLAKSAGADNFCVTSALFKGDPHKEYEKLASLL